MAGRQQLYSAVGYRRTVCRRTARLEFHLNIRTTTGWKNELRTVSPHAKSVCCEDDFFGGIADFETTPLRRFETFQPHFPPGMSRHIPNWAQQANLRDSKTDCKIRTRMAEVVKNKNDPGCDRLPPPPPLLRHLTLLYHRTCGKPFDPNHAVSCPTGGVHIIRHTKPRTSAP